MQKQFLFRVVEFLAMVNESGEVIGNQVVFHVTHDNHPECEKYIMNCERKISVPENAAESEFKIERIWR